MGLTLELINIQPRQGGGGPTFRDNLYGFYGAYLKMNDDKLCQIAELVGISLGHFVHCSQMFTQVWRGRIQPTTKDLTRICQRLLSSIYFKLRKLKPCLVSKLQIKADIDEDHELQLSLTGKFLQFMVFQ